jgi:hypothetical protein
LADGFCGAFDQTGALPLRARSIDPRSVSASITGDGNDNFTT